MVDLLGHGRISVSDLVFQHFNLLPQFTGCLGLRLNSRQSVSQLLGLTHLGLKFLYPALG